MTTTRRSMCLNVRGAIKDLSGSRAKGSAFTDDDGRPLTRVQAIDALMDDLAKGREVIPMNAKCGNPCQNSPKCAGFNFGKGGGCPGYPVDEGADHGGR